jgi:hypothetical protein
MIVKNLHHTGSGNNKVETPTLKKRETLVHIYQTSTIMRVPLGWPTAGCSNHTWLLLTACLYCLLPAQILAEQPKQHSAENHSVQSKDLPDIHSKLPSEKEKAVDGEWIDTLQRGMTFTIDATARWVDQFFGDPRAFDDQPAIASKATNAIGRLSAGSEWDERDGLEPTANFRSRFYLPHMGNRLSAIFGRFNAEEFLAGDDSARLALIRSTTSEDNWLIGLGFDPVIRDNQRLSLGAGFRNGLSLDPYLRARYLVQRGVTERSQIRWQSVVFWQGNDGLGVSQRLDYEVGIGRRFLGRWSGRGTYAERTEGIRWRSSASLFYLHSENRAYAVEAWSLGESDRGVSVEDYGMRGIYRTRYLREWFFIEGWVGTHWPREKLEQERKQQWIVGFQFEILFGQPIMQRKRQNL